MIAVMRALEGIGQTLCILISTMFRARKRKGSRTLEIEIEISGTNDLYIRLNITGWIVRETLTNLLVIASW